MIGNILQLLLAVRIPECIIRHQLCCLAGGFRCVEIGQGQVKVPACMRDCDDGAIGLIEERNVRDRDTLPLPHGATLLFYHRCGKGQREMLRQVYIPRLLNIHLVRRWGLIHNLLNPLTFCSISYPTVARDEGGEHLRHIVGTVAWWNWEYLLRGKTHLLPTASV